MTTKTVSIVGDGGWGLAVAILCNQAGHDVRVWGIETDYVREVAETRESTKYLPGFPLDPGIVASGDKGRPVVIDRPDSPAAAAFLTIARRISEAIGA